MGLHRHIVLIFLLNAVARFYIIIQNNSTYHTNTICSPTPQVLCVMPPPPPPPPPPPVQTYLVLEISQIIDAIQRNYFAFRSGIIDCVLSQSVERWQISLHLSLPWPGQQQFLRQGMGLCGGATICGAHRR